MDYKKEYGRYKKKVETQKKEIEKFRDEADGYRELLEANNAIIAAILHTVCATEEIPLKVQREIIDKAVNGQYSAGVKMDAEDMGAYLLYCEEGKDETA